MYYDREGNRIGMWRWVELHGDWEYCRVAETMVGELRVSTVWLGLDHNFRPPPLIFETMVFDEGTTDSVEWGGVTREFNPSLDEFTRRHTTEAQALSGHDQVAAELLALLAGAKRVTDAQRPPDR